MEKHPLSRGDHARDHESGSVTRKETQTPSLDSYHDAESSGDDGSSSSSNSLACERRVGNASRAPKVARDRDRAAARSDARSPLANTCAQAASSEVVRLPMRSKLP